MQSKCSSSESSTWWLRVAIVVAQFFSGFVGVCRHLNDAKLSGGIPTAIGGLDELIVL